MQIERDGSVGSANLIFTSEVDFLQPPFATLLAVWRSVGIKDGIWNMHKLAFHHLNWCGGKINEKLLPKLHENDRAGHNKNKSNLNGDKNNFI